MMQNDFFYNRLLRLPLFQGLGKGDFIEIAGRTRLEFQTFPKGSILVKQDELCTGLYFVIDGEVCSSRWSVDKKYELKEWFALPCVLQPESVFGLVTCYTRTFIAASPLQVLRVEKNAVRDILFDYSTFRINYLNFLSSAVQNKEKTMWRMSVDNLAVRFVNFLSVRCVRPAGRKDLHISMVDLAQELLATRLRVSRMLKFFASEGLLILKRERIIVPNFEKLLMWRLEGDVTSKK